MALSDKEQLLLEALKSMLDGQGKLGLNTDKDDAASDESSLQFLRENLKEQFGLDVNNLTHANSIRSAFDKVHCYKYLNDPKFREALIREFKGMAIPGNEQLKALQAYDRILKEMEQSKKGMIEKDSGWHPDLDEVMATSKIEQYKD